MPKTSRTPQAVIDLFKVPGANATLEAELAVIKMLQHWVINSEYVELYVQGRLNIFTRHPFLINQDKYFNPIAFPHEGVRLYRKENIPKGGLIAENPILESARQLTDYHQLQRFVQANPDAKWLSPVWFSVNSNINFDFEDAFSMGIFPDWIWNLAIVAGAFYIVLTYPDDDQLTMEDVL